MKITHTEVDKKYSGKGIFTELVKIAVEYARHKKPKSETTLFPCFACPEKDDYSDILE